MSDVVTMKVTGMDEIEENLLELGAQLGLKALTQAARKAFLPVVQTAVRLAPRHLGDLAAAIRLTVKKPKSGDSVVSVGIRIAPDKLAADKEAVPSRRWHFAELGTVKMAAHPYLRPALDANAAEVLDLLKAELVKSIARALKKRGKGT